MSGQPAQARIHDMTEPTNSPSLPSELLEVIANLAEFHREHEKFYSQAPLQDAVRLEAQSRILKALAAHWQEAQPTSAPLANPFAGAEDLNAPGLTAESGVLFMEGEGEPAEILRLKRDLESIASDVEEIGGWLARAMEQACMSLVPWPGSPPWRAFSGSVIRSS